jgi:glyoxylase-like metal-dependent hydrolase (beta-lactamase superfamily II)
MRRHPFALILSLFALPLAAWLGGALRGEKPVAAWEQVAPGIWRTSSMPHGHALVADGRALLIDCPRDASGLLKDAKVSSIDAVVLTHHHRDTCTLAAEFVAKKVPVRAPKQSAEWLSPAAVAKFWSESIPLRNSRTAYFVHPTGIDGIDYSLGDQTFDWRGWSISVVPTPGHSRDHVAFAVTRELGQTPWVFCGDALAAPGKLWAPFTTDWDHWTDAGLSPTVKSLRELAELKPRALYPAHGAPITQQCVEALEQTAVNVEEMAFLKSFERFSKQRLGNAPTYPFLVPRTMVGSAGEQPWAKVSDHVYITGNTYVLISDRDRAFAVIDPWGKRSVEQVAKLRQEIKLGRLELVMFSHAHYDHYDGVYDLPGYAAKDFRIWSLDRVAEPVGDPLRLRAPFLDARPVRFDRRLHDGDSAAWREYTFRFHHLPGQSEYTMGVETTIDGKRCWFTADNFFHQDQYSGTGGWMGLNRSWPLPYAHSAQMVLDAAPNWVLAEHGGPYAFSAEDYRRRVRWGEASAKAADALCVSGHHRREWDPYRVQAQPLLQKATAGATIKVELIATAVGDKPEAFAITLGGRGLLPDQEWKLEAAPGKPKSVVAELKLADKITPGRHVFALRVAEANIADALDVFFAVDVESPP